ncbi:CYTH and CHAD domain-containing protein [Kocuria marina]|uniref:CYTH and CHAD domain-containing protein n=1 Tax=Kocuria marina TaxID=223184 RepID=UPI0019D1D12A|nr:CYTH and CHAD domain-containing protein [Kocuria indica]MBN6812179.1 CYTH and CHAD domain-containing protein [Kocuria indica]MBN6843943.1 CYTH and CHAD domain-containing protein [Kocuria indica]
MVTQQVEIERKYDVAGQRTPRLKLHKLKNFTVGDPVEHEMSATYYDTADLALAHAKVAVRRRTGGSDDGWHVKYQAGQVRGELHYEPLKTSAQRIPAALRKVLTGLTLGEELTPVATINTHRTVYPVLGEDGQYAELCLDAVGARDERGRVTREWSECEVELTRDDLTQKQARTVFEAVESVLYAAGAAPSSSVAKIARALGQDGGDSVRVVAPEHAAEAGASDDAALPDHASSGTDDATSSDGGVSETDAAKASAESARGSATKSEMTGDAETDKGSGKKPGKKAKAEKTGKKSKKTSGKSSDKDSQAPAAAEPEPETESKPTGADVLAAMLARLTGELQRWDFAVRIDAPDSVHQLRVRSRALRAVLQAAHGFVTEDVVADLEQRLKGVARVLGDARDQEVARQRLDVLLEAQPSGVVTEQSKQELRAAADQLGVVAGRTVRRELDGAAYLQLVRDLRALAAGQDITEDAAQLSAKDFAKTVLGAALNRVLVSANAKVPDADVATDVSDMAAEVGRRITLPGLDAMQTAAAFDVVHETRKAAKSARYVSEALGHAHAKAGKKRVRAAAVAKDYQDDLGVITDAAVMEEWLARASRSFQRTGKDRYAVGLLHGMELSDLRDGMLEAPEILEDLVEDLCEVLPPED